MFQRVGHHKSNLLSNEETALMPDCLPPKAKIVYRLQPYGR